MRVVLDTNILVSAILTPGGPAHQVVQMVLRGDLQIYMDHRLKEEYQEVLSRGKFGLPRKKVETFLEGLFQDGQEVLTGPVQGHFPDLSDRAFLEVAVAAQAEALITRNIRHFQAAHSLRVRVMTPEQFLVWWLRKP